MQSSQQGHYGDDLIGTVDEPDRWEAALRRGYRYTIWVRRIVGELLKVSAMVGAFSATVTISEPAAAVEEVIHLFR